MRLAFFDELVAPVEEETRRAGLCAVGTGRTAGRFGRRRREIGKKRRTFDEAPFPRVLSVS